MQKEWNLTFLLLVCNFNTLIGVYIGKDNKDYGKIKTLLLNTILATRVLFSLDQGSRWLKENRTGEEGTMLSSAGIWSHFQKECNTYLDRVLVLYLLYTIYTLFQYEQQLLYDNFTFLKWMFMSLKWHKHRKSALPHVSNSVWIY